MQRLLLEFIDDSDYELILSIARRLNCKIIPNETEEEPARNGTELSPEKKAELERRLTDYQNNPNDTYTMEDVKKELEEKFGRKI
ncbi:MAG: addiction module protein [Leptospiraceae bacterium]|nr:addiction module protein [Leptospiraceae bacterium]MCP5501068.1 addiction module protein [Leptospiraceae bacterium]